MRKSMRAAAVVLTAAALTFAMTACETEVGGKLGQLQTIADTCPRDNTVSAFVALSADANQRGPKLTATRVQAVQAVATRVAVCGGGNLKVVAFGPSLAATDTVYDDELHPDGATENARLLRVSGIVGGAMAQIEQNLPAAFKQLSPKGTDPIGQLQAAQEFMNEQSPNVMTEVLIETAGLASQVSGALTPETAPALASAVEVPRLTNASLTVAGLGHVGSGPPPATAVVEGLIAFYSGICHRTGARACTATTNIAVGA